MFLFSYRISGLGHHLLLFDMRPKINSVDSFPSWWDKWPQVWLKERKVLVKSSLTCPAGSLTENVGSQKKPRPSLGNARNGSLPFLRFGPQHQRARAQLDGAGMRLIISGRDIVLPRTTQPALESLESCASLRLCIGKIFQMGPFGTEQVSLGHLVQHQSYFDPGNIIGQDLMLLVLLHRCIFFKSQTAKNCFSVGYACAGCCFGRGGAKGVLSIPLHPHCANFKCIFGIKSVRTEYIKKDHNAHSS